MVSSPSASIHTVWSEPSNPTARCRKPAGRLWAQRLSWQRGALENLGAYGLTPPTARYWAQQFGLGYGVIALSSYLLLILLTVLALNAWIWFPFWLGLGLLFSFERCSLSGAAAGGRASWP